MVELFVFHEMKAASSRTIEVLHFRTPPPATSDALVVPADGFAEQPAPTVVQILTPTLAARVDQIANARAGLANFNVRHATCTLESDRQRLIGVIEDCGGGGADSFNAWIQDLLKPDDGSTTDKARGHTRPLMQWSST
jgi:hypothetical protein